MLRVEEAPHDVPDAVGELVDLDEEPHVLLGEEAVHHLPELLDGLRDVVEERLLVDRLLAHRPGVDRPAHRLVEAEPLRQVLRQAAGGGDLDARRELRRVEVDRREVELDLGRDGREVEAADARELHEGVELERKVTQGDHSPGFSVTGSLPFGSILRRPPSGRTVSVIGILMTGGSPKSLLCGPKTSVLIVPTFDSSRTSSTENSFLFLGAKNGSDV